MFMILDYILEAKSLVRLLCRNYISSFSHYLFGVGSRKMKAEENLVKPVSQKVVSLSQRVQQPGVRSLAQLREDRFKRLGSSSDQQNRETAGPKVVNIFQHVEQPGVRSLAQLREDRFKRLGSSSDQQNRETAGPKVVNIFQHVEQPGVRSLAQVREDRFKRLGRSLEHENEEAGNIAKRLKVRVCTCILQYH